MKYWLVTLLLVPNILIGQGFYEVDSRRSATDTLFISEPVDLRTFAQKLNLTILDQTNYNICLERRGKRFYTTCLYQIPVGKILDQYSVSFTTRSYESKRVSQLYSTFFLSAFKQEYLPQQTGNLYSLKEKSVKEFRRKSLINMGLGQQYFYRDNPFASSKGLSIGFAYAWETLHYIPIFGGAFFGATTQDKVAIPLIGLASLAVWKLLILPILAAPYIHEYNNLVRSGYEAPLKIMLR